MNTPEKKVSNTNSCGLFECTHANECKSRNWGGSNRLMYDFCAYEKDLVQSVAPIGYMLYEGKYENCDKCVAGPNQFWHPFDPEIIDRESDLLNITRPLSKCPQFKYNPNCRGSESCFSTYNPSNPIVLPPEICPIVYNNIPKVRSPGWNAPNPNLICNKL